MSKCKNSLEIIVMRRLKSHFITKYQGTPTRFQQNIITNIIYNEKSHIVALFKDFLILDDTSEFLKRFYKIREILVRLPKFFDYYETYSKIYPNYTSLSEGKYIYRNIQRKQRMIDLQEQMELETKKNKKSKNKFKTERVDEVFSTDVYDSIINDRNNEDIEMLFNIKLNEIEKAEDDAVAKIEENIINIIQKIEETKVNTIPVKEIKQVVKPNYTKFLSKENSNISNPKTERTLIERIELNLLKMNNKKYFQKKKSKNMPLSHRGNSISINDSVSAKTPLTDRTSSSCKRNQKASSNINGVNNIIYIINQNPKFTTQVNVYNNLDTSKIKKRIATSARSSNSHKNQSIHISSTKTNATIMDSSNKNKVKKRNISSSISNHKNINSNYGNAIKTAREMGYKEMNIIKSSIIPPKKNVMKQTEGLTARTSRINYPKQQNNEAKTSRNVKNESRNNNSSTKNGFISRNDSLSKLGFIDAANVKKKIIKGIHIKNFSKIFNANLSQLQTKPEKYGKVGKH